MALAMFPIPLRARSPSYTSGKIWSAETEREFCYSILSKGVAIAHVSPEMKAFGAQFNVIDLISRKHIFKKESNWNSRTRKERIVLVILAVRSWQFEALRERTIGEAHPILIKDFEPWGLAMILDLKLESDVIGGDIEHPIQHIFGSDGNIGPQLTFGGSSHLVNKVTSRRSEADREQPQNYCKCGDEDRRNSSNFLVSVMNETPNVEQSDFERGVRGGAIIFIGLCCLASFAAIFLCCLASFAAIFW